MSVSPPMGRQHLVFERVFSIIMFTWSFTKFTPNLRVSRGHVFIGDGGDLGIGTNGGGQVALVGW